MKRRKAKETPIEVIERILRESRARMSPEERAKADARVEAILAEGKPCTRPHFPPFCTRPHSDDWKTWGDGTITTSGDLTFTTTGEKN